MIIYDYLCSDCGNSFELFVRNAGESKECPRCRSARVARKPVMQMSLGGMRRGRLVDMSSNSCPCGCGSRKHAHR